MAKFEDHQDLILKNASSQEEREDKIIYKNMENALRESKRLRQEKALACDQRK
mgnify:CR=1 FL=1